MKANSCGTMDEQIRARNGFKTFAERKASGANMAKDCASCLLLEAKGYTKSDGGIGISYRCVHVTAGFSTRISAGCDKWERRVIQELRPFQ